MTKNGHFSVRKTGTFVSDAVFEFFARAAYFDSPLLAEVPGRLVSDYSPSNDAFCLRGDKGWMKLEMEPGRTRSQNRYSCPVDSSHATELYYDPLVIELSGGVRLADMMLCDSEAGDYVILVTSEFVERLKGTPFEGYVLSSPVEIAENTTEAPEPVLQELQFRGCPIERPKCVVGAPNACPHCERAPLICQRCGSFDWDCPNCGHAVCVSRHYHGGDGDRRLILPAKEDIRILDGNRWDGSDFIYGTGPTTSTRGHFVTKRVLRWLEKMGVMAYEAIPALIDTSTMTSEQLERLEAAARE